ncbi:MAG: efflux RND transporter permease subunit [Verrucomicrobiae bacterium]|nr:efflux RND transporter permease subunit [Verrucomicrobiae bacterium]NNJ42682.1 efflux RND transporter permease subunit [Akkermansiaceae bacterium]
MLSRLIKFSLERAPLVLILAGVLLAFVALQLSKTPVDVFPELNAPTVVIMTEAPGLAADEVEQYVTFPIESSVNGVPGVRRVRTSSAIGLSIAYVEFDWGTDIYTARQLVSERLDSVREDLPPDAHAEMTPITSITGEILLLAVSSPDQKMSDLEIRAYAEYDLRNKLLAIPGVSQVSVIGGELPEYQVLVRQDDLRLYDLSIQDVIDASAASHSTLSAGYLPDVDSLEMPVRQSGRVRSVEDIAGTVIKYHHGFPVTIGQVANVKLGPAPKRGTGADGGQRAVVMTIQKAPGTNTITITETIDSMLDELDPSLPEGLHINRQIFRQADFIDLSVSNVVHALRDAAIIVSVILILFLLNVRTTVITLTAIPLSLAVGLLVFDWMNMTINVMTLGGLAIAVGSLVDDAIIDVENVFRRLNEDAARPESDRQPRLKVILEASNEIRPAMVFATIIIVLAFLPLMFLEGIEGRFFRPLGIAFGVSIIASLVVALTVTPAMCRYLMRGKSNHGESTDPPLVRWLKSVYMPIVRWAVKFKKSVIGVAVIATALALLLSSTFGKSFLPEFNEGTFTVGLFAPPGTSLKASDRMASAIEQQLLALDGVKSVTRRTGRAERDEHAEPVSNSEIDVTIKPGFENKEVRQQISKILEKVPGITTNIGQPIEHRLSHILSGTPAAIAISIYGDDLEKLRVIAKEIEGVLKPLPGARDVAASREVMIQSLPIDYRPADLAAYGLTPRSAAEQVRNAVFGVSVAEVNEGVRRYDLAVRLEEEERDELRDISNLVLRGKGGALVRLHEVADIGPEMTSNLIGRENAQRRAVVTLNVEEGYNLGDLVEEVQIRVDPIVQRFGYTVKYGGQFEAQQAASRTIYLYSGLVVLIMVFLLQLAIGSFRVALLVLVNLPLALIGGIVAIYLAESPGISSNTAALFGLGGHYTAPVISIASMVGFITLFGIAVRNGILLVNHYDHLIKHEGKTMFEAIVQGSSERLVPILMTALTAALAVVPIVLQGDKPGNEILAPLSVVILGGLLSSTFLNLIIVPAGYAAIHRVSAKQPNPKTKPTK